MQILHLSCQVQRLPGYQAQAQAQAQETKWLNAWLLLRVEDTADVQQ